MLFISGGALTEMIYQSEEPLLIKNKIWSLQISCSFVRYCQFFTLREEAREYSLQVGDPVLS